MRSENILELVNIQKIKRWRPTSGTCICIFRSVLDLKQETGALLLSFTKLSFTSYWAEKVEISEKNEITIE